jgi:hypothetical protein
VVHPKEKSAHTGLARERKSGLTRRNLRQNSLRRRPVSTFAALGARVSGKLNRDKYMIMLEGTGI